MPNLSRTIILTSVYVTGVVLLAVVCLLVARNAAPGFDHPIQYAIHSLTSPVATFLAKLATELGSTMIIAGATLAIGAWLAYQHRYRAAVFLAGSVGGAVVLNQILKHLFERSRPELWTPLVSETGFSFPSGHTMASSALALAVIGLLWSTRWRTPAIVTGICYMLAVGLSRVYLGVHYPTDILGGWLVSGLWILTLYLIIKPNPEPAAHDA